MKKPETSGGRSEKSTDSRNLQQCHQKVLRTYYEEEGEELGFFRLLQRKTLCDHLTSEAACIVQIVQAFGSSLEAPLVMRIYWGCVVARPGKGSFPSPLAAVVRTADLMSFPNSGGSERSVPTAGPKAVSCALPEVDRSADMPGLSGRKLGRLWA